jgi:hypothetical protein
MSLRVDPNAPPALQRSARLRQAPRRSDTEPTPVVEMVHYEELADALAAAGLKRIALG